MIQATDELVYAPTYGHDVLFSFNPFNNQYKKAYQFIEGGPWNGTLIQASNGKLYGLNTGKIKLIDGILFSYMHYFW